MVGRIISILQLPERCLVEKKITKAFFKRNFDLTSIEKSLLEDFSIVISMDWIAAISPTNSNIIVWEDENSIFEEVQVISIQIGETNFERDAQKVAELIQKYIPYLILLIIYNNEFFCVNTCDKHINQNDRNKRTILKRHFSEVIPIGSCDDKQQGFLNSIAFDQLDKTNLKTFYAGFTQGIIALKAAELNGIFTPRSLSHSEKDMEYLEQIETRQSEIKRLQNQSKKETQLNQQIELNRRIHDLRNQIKALQELIIKQ